MTNHNGNGRSAAAGLVSASGSPLVVDLKTRHIKKIVVPIAQIVAFLQMDGTTTYKIEGWPDGAEVVGLGPPMSHPQLGLAITLVVYHPAFPITLPGKEPGNINLELAEYALEGATEPDDEADEFE